MLSQKIQSCDRQRRSGEPRSQDMSVLHSHECIGIERREDIRPETKAWYQGLADADEPCKVLYLASFMEDYYYIRLHYTATPTWLLLPALDSAEAATATNAPISDPIAHNTF